MAISKEPQKLRFEMRVCPEHPRAEAGLEENVTFLRSILRGRAKEDAGAETGCREAFAVYHMGSCPEPLSAATTTNQGGSWVF